MPGWSKDCGLPYGWQEEPWPKTKGLNLSKGQDMFMLRPGLDVDRSAMGSRLLTHRMYEQYDEYAYSYEPQ